jgi:Domain of unknown function (DUF4265)
MSSISGDAKDPSEYVVHQDPIWRDRSDFIIDAELPEMDRPRRFEQLFARQIAENRFEVCCIPFFLYDIALGDIVITAMNGDRKYVVEKIVQPSGRYVFRAWFGNSFHPRDAIVDQLKTLGSLVEWSSRNLVAVDSADYQHAQFVADFLAARQTAGQLEYESGRS